MASSQLVVSDRGPGIPEGQLERVFEPFVTFREQGLGLGLAISRSIVTAHSGSIRAENNVAGGATLPLFPPRCRTRQRGRDSRLSPIAAGQSLLARQYPPAPGRETVKIQERQYYYAEP